VQVASSVEGTRASSFAWFGAGGRLGASAAITRAFDLRLRADAIASLAPHTVVVEGQRAWSTSPVVASLALEALVHFW
jgi:hypothetical protein